MLEVGEASTGLFSMLGVQPLLGRVFLPGEEGPGTSRLAVLSHRLWASRFGSDPDVIGTVITLNEEPFEVIGVLPRGFRLRSALFDLHSTRLDSGERALWLPLAFDGTENWGAALETMGRLAPGATVTRLSAEVDALLRGNAPPERLGFRIAHPKEEIVSGHRSSLLLLLASSGLLLLIACANIAALLLSEAAGRRQEMATRMALGAGRFRIARQLLTESVLIGVLGSVLGFAVASAGIPGFLALAPPLPRLEGVGMSHSVLLFAILTGVGTGILFGFAPALSLQSGSSGAAQAMGSRGSTGRWRRLHGSLMGGELALTMVLLVAGGLLARSFLKLVDVDPGFGAGSVGTVRVHLQGSETLDPAYRHDFFMRAVERLRAIPGVRYAGGVDGLPFPGRVSGSRFQIVGESGEEGEVLILRNHFVLPGYLETMGIQVLAGRIFTDADARADSPPVMVVSEQTARQHWPDESPLNARVIFEGVVFEIVGIVGDVREGHLSDSPEAMIYRTGPQIPRNLSLVASVDGSAADLVPEMREAIRAVDPRVSLSQESTLSALVASSTGSERFRTVLIMAFGILATTLASVGVFGITAHSVSKRTRELGIRMALGAESRNLTRAVLYETMLPGAVGIGVGLLGALAVSRLMTVYLFGIAAWDKPTYWGVGALLAALTAGSAFLPARRIGRLHPVDVLREE
jgi:predicted permease